MKKFLSLFLVFVFVCLPMCLFTGCGEEEILSTYTEEDAVDDATVDEMIDGKNDETGDVAADDGAKSGQSVNPDKTQNTNKGTNQGSQSGNKQGSKNNKQSSAKKSNNKKVNKREASVFENVPSELKGTTVKFATWISHKSLDYAHVFSDFTDLTGIKVDIVPIPQTEYIVKLTGMKASGTAPDIVVDNFEFPRTLPLMQPLLESTTGINTKDSVWDQSVAKLYTVNGKCYAINGSNSNWEMASPLTYYNIPLLKKYGIKTPADYVKANNWNLDTMVKCAQDCKDAGLFTPCEIDITVFSNVYADGPYHYDASKNKYVNTMGTEKFRKTWSWLATNREKGLFKLSNSWASSLTSGQTGFVLTGAYGLRKQPGWFYQMDPSDIGYTYLPKAKKSDSKYPTSTFCRGYGIADGAKNPKGAGYFLRYFLNDDWYNDDEIFKDSRAAQMHKDLLKIKDFSHPQLDGIVKVQYADYAAFFNDLTMSTPQQVASNIDRVSRQMDYCVKKANKLISDKK